jgi:hypothetical protein
MSTTPPLTHRANARAVVIGCDTDQWTVFALAALGSGTCSKDFEQAEPESLGQP